MSWWFSCVELLLRFGLSQTYNCWLRSLPTMCLLRFLYCWAINGGCKVPSCGVANRDIRWLEGLDVGTNWYVICDGGASIHSIAENKWKILWHISLNVNCCISFYRLNILAIFKLCLKVRHICGCIVSYQVVLVFNNRTNNFWLPVKPLSLAILILLCWIGSLNFNLFLHLIFEFKFI